MIPVILKSRVPFIEWKRCQLLNDCSYIKSYIYYPNQNDSIEQYCYNQNIQYINNLIEFQQKYQKYGILDSYAITRYLTELNNIINQNELTQSIKSKIEYTTQILEQLYNEAFIGDYYIPQVTTDSTYHRLYYQPIYRIPEKVIRNLIQKFGFVNREYFTPIKVDVNGALIRVVLKMLYKMTGEFLYKVIHDNYENDIYDVIADKLVNYGISIDRDELKQQLIILINNGGNGRQSEIFKDFFVNHIRTFINSNIAIVRKYMTIYSNKRLSELTERLLNNNKEHFFLFVNLDGGVLVTNKNNIKLDLVNDIQKELPVRIEPMN